MGCMGHCRYHHYYPCHYLLPCCLTNHSYYCVRHCQMNLGGMMMTLTIVYDRWVEMESQIGYTDHPYPPFTHEFYYLHNLWCWWRRCTICLDCVGVDIVNSTPLSSLTEGEKEQEGFILISVTVISYKSNNLTHRMIRHHSIWSD